MNCSTCGFLLGDQEPYCPKYGKALAPANQGALGGGMSSQMEIHRAKAVVMRNNKFFIGLTLLASVFALFLAACFAIMVFVELFPEGGFNTGHAIDAVRWAFGALVFGLMCPAMWKMAMGMFHSRVKMDSRGVDFTLGTKKTPQELFLPWDKVAAIQQKRVGMAQQFTVQGTDGSYARYTSYTFFRPKKVARLIAQRTGLVIQKT
jgi:hypothetical protein